MKGSLQNEKVSHGLTSSCPNLHFSPCSYRLSVRKTRISVKSTSFFLPWEIPKTYLYLPSSRTIHIFLNYTYVFGYAQVSTGACGARGDIRYSMLKLQELWGVQCGCWEPGQVFWRSSAASQQLRHHNSSPTTHTQEGTFQASVLNFCIISHQHNLFLSSMVPEYPE